MSEYLLDVNLLPGSERSDVFLLGLAVHKGGKLATLDRRLPPEAVQGGTDALELITA